MPVALLPKRERQIPVAGAQQLHNFQRHGLLSPKISADAEAMRLQCRARMCV